jgi:hypothetical protein
MYILLWVNLLISNVLSFSVPMTDIITIMCLVQGNSVDHVFPVDIVKSKNIGHLKDAIKEKKSPRFNDIAADELTLWQVNISIHDAEQLDLQNIKDYGAKKLMPRELATYFDELAKDHIHIIVERPSGITFLPC